MQEHEIIEKIQEYFEDNYEVMRLEGGHAITEDAKQQALRQVLLYYKKMKEVATKVTHTEVKLTLPEQKTNEGRNFTIQGIVDIVRDDTETWMYDIKTHDKEYVESNIDLYEKQLNVYAHIWQELRQEELDSTAVISTSIPQPLNQAFLLNDTFRVELEMAKWNPLVPIAFKQENVKETIADFAKIVDCIEDKNFAPASIETLKAKMGPSAAIFATRVCRNCDARFSCSSFREYAVGKGKGARDSFAKYFEDFGNDSDQEEWVNANLQSKNPDKINVN
jgi:PD-(D/E)XK nuclease superfamily